MKALTANLASRPFRNNTVIGSIVAAVATMLLIATIYNLYVFLSYGSSYALLLDDQDRNRAKLEALEVEERSLVKQIEARDFETAFDQGSVANELILKRTFSWTELFNKLENLMPPDVMMSAIRPNVTSSDIVIRVEGVGKTHLAFLSLQEHLLAHESFSEVYPVSIRRLNPSRPEITFILNFNYRQSERAPADAVVAETVEAAPAGVTPAAAGGGATDERASLHDRVLRAAVEASALPVGRDGRPRTLEVIARRMVAPGGVYDPPALHLSGSTADDGRRGSRQQAVAPAAVGGQTSAPPKVAPETRAQADSAPPVPTPTVTPSAGAPSGRAGAGADAAGAAPAAGQTGKPKPMSPSSAAGADIPPTTQTPATTTPDRSRRLQRRRPPAAATGGAPAGASGAVAGSATPAQTTPGTAETAAQGTAVPPSQPAARPDLDLNFTNSPVRDVYRILGQAHGVRFVVDAAIERNATLNVNLSGLSLQDVITTMAEVANQRITQLRAGIYQVVAISKGDTLLDPPVEEENLPATEGAP